MPRSSRRPTINDVAATAGVSKGTVSRVLNGKNWISPDTRAAVHAAVDSLGYIPNGNAQNLARERTNCIALVFSEPTLLLAQNAIFATVLERLTSELTARGYSAVLMFAHQEQQRPHVLNQVQRRHVDGVIMLTGNADDPIIPMLSETGIPMVTTGPVRRGSTLLYSGVDDAMGSTQAIEHLLSLGRSRIGIITGPVLSYGSELRLSAGRDALGVLDDPARIEVAAQFTAAEGYERAKTVLARCPDLDALYVASDVLAQGAMAYVRESGRRIPQDVAIVGFDNISTAETLDPPLTTIAPTETDTSVVTLILDLIDGLPVQSIDVPTRLVRRESA